MEVEDLNEITTEEELRDAPVTILIRKSFGVTQEAAIRRPVDAAKKLAETGKNTTRQAQSLMKDMNWRVKIIPQRPPG